MGGKPNPERDKWVGEQRHKLGQVFAAVRGAEGQVHVAERAGMSRSAYDPVEKGTGNPELSTVLKAAYALKLPLGDVLLAALPDLLGGAATTHNPLQ